MGIRVLGLSLITNRAAGLSTERLSHDDVLAVAERAAPKLLALLKGLLPRISVS
jgi:purine-nucleoside phosphorylase